MVEKVLKIVDPVVEKKKRRKRRKRNVRFAEGNLSSFALRKEHYGCKTDLTSNLFVSDTRPKCLRDLYEIAGRMSPTGDTPAGRRSPPLLCTPVLGAQQRRLRQKVDVEIETRLPAAIEDLRKWTSTEALGDMTVEPGLLARINTNITLVPEDASDGAGFSSGDDEPIDHKLPSPEEQFLAIVSKFQPEVVAIDTSGRGFDRMCLSRRSLLHVDAGCEQHRNHDSQTVKRRTRSRKPRGKRRNTITGTDQKEIRDAIAGDASSPVDEPESPDSGAVIRSHSSDLLKKNSFENQNKKSHFNTLRQWGRSRLKLINRSPSDNSRDSSKLEKPKTNKSTAVTQDIDDINIYETVTMRKKKNVNNKKMSHERNNSYSSSEKSLGIPISTSLSGPMSLAVKLREVGSSSRRRRLNGNGTAPIKDEPHSSSGNWSASSESGRTSIGSEITSTTAAPRSTTSAATSSNSLNVPHGPPSSIVSRRRFLNTSGSGSVTSEGTLTPDIIHDLHDDMETSSEFSCDTEGYYTSFHMDSGLKTLKEEELSLPITPLHTTSTFSNSSGNQTVLTAENEYELFGKGSTSTTTSSAGTVCTTLLAAGSDRSLGPIVPERKSSLSKLNKSRSSSGSSSINLERSFSGSTGSNSDRTGTIKRNTSSKSNSHYRMSSEPQLEQILNVKENINYNKNNHETIIADIHEVQTTCIANTGAESPDSGHNTSSSPIDDSVSSAHGGKLSCSEMDYSESSDLENVDRIERIRVKTTINSSRIPSLCVITPNNSDDESVKSSKQETKENSPTAKSNIDINNINNNVLKDKISNRPKLALPPQETDLDTIVFNDEVKNYDNVYVDKENLPHNVISDNVIPDVKKSHDNNLLSYMKSKKLAISRPYKSSLLPLNNLMCKLKEVFPQKLNMKKSAIQKETDANDVIYPDTGEYVTIADVRNNNQKVNIYNTSGVYYSNDIVKRNLQTVLSGKLQETEYVSLNELPTNITPETLTNNMHASELNNESLKRFGAKVTLDSSGKVIYSSDSLKRRKGAHTTFEPGPFVKDLETTDECDSINLSRTILAHTNIIDNKICANDLSPEKHSTNRPLSPQLGKVIIRAPSAHSSSAVPTSEVVRMPPMNIVTPTYIVRPMSPKAISKGAYVNIQDAEGISLSPSKDNNQDFRPLADRPLKIDIDKHGYKTNPPMQNDKQKSWTNIQNSSFNNGDSIPPYWTLPQNKQCYMQNNLKDLSNIQTQNINMKSKVEILAPDSNFSAHQFIPISPNFTNSPINSATNNLQGNNNRSENIFNFAPRSSVFETKNDSFKMSPIDPRSSGNFQASTPTQNNNLEVSNTLDVANKISSPVKSTMSNEELYAVIHKSKKKMNIKSPPLDRAISPALSSASLSPVSSENCIPGRITPNKIPETGYLSDVRVRHSWSPNSNDHILSPIEHFENRQENFENRRQGWTCQDRLGPAPQTSRLDFKKLLLQHGVRLNLHGINKQSGKPSAVERLRLSKETGNIGNVPNQNISNLNILDLSGSPKTYTHRRVIKPNNINPSSPSRTHILIKESKTTPKILLSPKTQWRFSSPRSDVLSSPIPEVFNEDESPNSSNEKNHDQIIKSFSHLNENEQPRSFQRIGASVKRTLIPVIKENVAENDLNNIQSIGNGIAALDVSFRKDETNAQNVNYKETSNSASNSPDRLSRAEYLQAQKLQFLSQNIPPMAFPAKGFIRNTLIPNKPMEDSKNNQAEDVNTKERKKCPSPPTLETAL